MASGPAAKRPPHILFDLASDGFDMDRLVLRKIAPALYGLSLALATPAAALNDALLTGPMAKMSAVERFRPAITAFTRDDGSIGRLEDYAGKVVVLNFWATWCAPCRAEMPSLEALQAALGAEGLAVVTMAFGRHDPAAVRRFWKEAGLQALPMHVDARTEIARALGIRGLPHTVILDREGQVVAELIGGADWAAPETLAVLRDLLPD